MSSSDNSISGTSSAPEWTAFRTIACSSLISVRQRCLDAMGS
jgi:hypothetical protein